MNTPLITTIILTYKRPKLLRRALDSVLSQTYPLFEVHVYDNASGDETPDVVQEFIKRDARVKYHCHAKNIGMMGNYEYALNRIATPYFSLLSDDDVVFPWFYEVAMRGFQSFPEAALSAGSTLIMSEQGKIIRVPLDFWSKEGLFPAPEGLLEMISKFPVPTCILFHQKVLQEAQIDKHNPLTWDCDFLIQISANHAIVIDKQPCGIFLHHDASYSNAQNLANWKQAYQSMVQRLTDFTQLSAGIKRSAVSLMQHDLKMINRAFILRALSQRQFKEAFRSAREFQQTYGLKAQSIVLLILTYLCQWIPSTLHLLLFAQKLKKMRNKESRLYRGYAKWLQLGEK
jgi:glycosyltransferase involved in cell wall biosynthesis